MPPDPNRKPKKPNPSLGKKRPAPVSVGSPASQERFETEVQEVEFVPAWDPTKDGPDITGLITSDFDFTFYVEQTDMCPFTPLFQNYFHVSDTLARDTQTKPTQIVLHANNRITFTGELGADETPTRRIHRTWRNWEIELNPTNREQPAPGAKYRNGTKAAYQLDGNSLAFRKCWADVPGERIVRRADVQISRRAVDEFLVGLYKHPEFGAYSFLVVTDETPTHYRVRHSDPVKVSPQDWKDRTRDPAKIAELEKDTGPKPDPDTITQWAAEITWTNYTAEINLLPP